MTKLSLLCLFLIFASCGKKSVIEPLFEAKSFFQATNGKPIKLIIPLTDKTMDPIAPAADLEQFGFIKEKGFVSFWEDIKSKFYNVAARFGQAKIQFSMEHSLAYLENGQLQGITPELIKKYAKSIKIKKVFFTFKRPCEIDPDNQECRDYIGILKKKTPSFDMLEKVFVNMSFFDPYKKPSDEFIFITQANEEFRKVSRHFLRPQSNIQSREFADDKSYVQNLNLGYYSSENPYLEEVYILKSRKHTRRKVSLIPSKEPQVLADRLINFFAQKQGINQEQMKIALKNELKVSKKNVLIDLNELRSFEPDLKEFLVQAKLSRNVCNNFLCVEPSLREGKLQKKYLYYLKGATDTNQNVFMVRGNNADIMKVNLIDKLADILNIPRSLGHEILNREIISYDNLLLVDLNRYPSLLDRVKNMYPTKKNKPKNAEEYYTQKISKRILPCSVDQCIPLASNEIKNRDILNHLSQPKDRFDLIYTLNVSEDNKVKLMKDIIHRVALERNQAPQQLSLGLQGAMIQLHDQIIINLNDKPHLARSFQKVFKDLNLSPQTCTSDKCIFLGTNNMDMKPVLSKSTSGSIDLYVDVNKVPDVVLLLKGYLELEIVLDI